MYEFRLYHNKQANEETIIFGYTLRDAFQRHKLNPVEWTLYAYEYVD